MNRVRMYNSQAFTDVQKLDGQNEEKMIFSIEWMLFTVYCRFYRALLQTMYSGIDLL